MLEETVFNLVLWFFIVPEDVVALLACSAGVFWACVHSFLLGFHLRFGNCGGLGRGNICRGSRS